MVPTVVLTWCRRGVDVVQDAAHPHMACLDPAGKFAFVCDLGCNSIIGYGRRRAYLLPSLIDCGLAIVACVYVRVSACVRACVPACLPVGLRVCVCTRVHTCAWRAYMHAGVYVGAHTQPRVCARARVPTCVCGRVRACMCGEPCCVVLRTLLHARYTLDAAAATLARHSELILHDGAGPRHMAFSPVAPYA